MTSEFIDKTFADLKRLGVREYKNDVLLPALKGIIEQCSPVGYGLLQEQSKTYNDFSELWHRLTKLYESACNSSDEEGTKQ